MIEVGQNDDFDLLTPDDLISIDFLFDIYLGPIKLYLHTKFHELVMCSLGDISKTIFQTCAAGNAAGSTQVGKAKFCLTIDHLETWI